MLLELLWKLLYRRSKLRLRVFRIIGTREGIVSRSIVYENIQRERFIQKSSFSDQGAYRAREIMDLTDVLNAIDGLKDVPFLMDKDGWRQLGAGTIDEAILKANAHLEEIRNKLASRADSQERGARRKSRPHLRIREISLKGIPPESEVLQLRNSLWKKAGRKRASWEPLGTTSAGHLCEILEIEGNREHRIP